MLSGDWWSAQTTERTHDPLAVRALYQNVAHSAADALRFTCSQSRHASAVPLPPLSEDSHRLAAFEIRPADDAHSSAP